jgi:hypothetical protein
MALKPFAFTKIIEFDNEIRRTVDLPVVFVKIQGNIASIVAKKPERGVATILWLAGRPSPDSIDRIAITAEA